MMLNEDMKKWCAGHADEAAELLRVLGKIPAPSHFEDKRADFILNWFEENGCRGAYIDEAKNVIWPVNVTENNPVAVVMAHTDIVFPDMEELEMREEDGKLYAPGIGDDTSNVVTLLMAAKYMAEKGVQTREGLLVVANSCEEGLGNLKGSKQIMKDFEGRVTELISLDGGPGWIVNDAVGSCRMKITINAQGGHSFGAFGNTNAIVQMAELITRLYEKEPPKKAKTTYNVGVIEGGTTVNSICAQCSVLYEYRSEDRDCLSEMDVFFNSVIDEFKAKGYDISVEVLGLRPCKGDVDEEKLSDLTKRVAAIIKECTGMDSHVEAASTDANSALAIGVPAVTIGSVVAQGAHTRGEWVQMDSIPAGLEIALATVAQYF